MAESVSGKLSRWLRSAVPKNRFARGAIVLAVLGGAAGALFLRFGPREATVVLAPSREDQTLTGWEVPGRAWEMDKKNDRYDGSFAAHGPAVMKCLVNELGVNRIRIEVRSGTENPVDYWSRFMRGEIGYHEVKRHFYDKVNDDADPSHENPAGFQWASLDFQVESFLLPMRRLLAERGETLIVNLCYVDFRTDAYAGTLRHAQAPAEYAELIAAAFERLRSRWGVEPDFFEVILEPDNTEHWRGAEIAHGARAAVSRLSERGFRPRVIAPSTAASDAAAAYFDAMQAADPGAPLDVLSYHRYGKLPARLSLSDIKQRATGRGIPVAMLEHTDGDYRELHEDLAMADASAWQMWGIAVREPKGEVDHKGGFHCMIDPGAPEAGARLSVRSRLLVPYYRHLRAGAVRLGAESDGSAHDALLFRNPDRRHVVLLRSERRGTVTLRGVPHATYGITHTKAPRGEIRDLGLLISVGQDAFLHVPGPGVTVLVEQAP